MNACRTSLALHIVQYRLSTWHSAGNSVCVFVHGFEPYFYIEAPHNFGPDDCEQLRSLLNVGQALKHCSC